MMIRLHDNWATVLAGESVDKGPEAAEDRDSALDVLHEIQDLRLELGDAEFEESGEAVDLMCELEKKIEEIQEKRFRRINTFGSVYGYEETSPPT
jgi:hypothetical protein